MKIETLKKSSVDAQSKKIQSLELDKAKAEELLKTPEKVAKQQSAATAKWLSENMEKQFKRITKVRQ